jgi:hypothetical protein
LLGAVVERGEDRYGFELFGPEIPVTEQRDAFMAFIRSIRIPVAEDQ